MLRKMLLVLFLVSIFAGMGVCADYPYTRLSSNLTSNYTFNDLRGLTVNPKTHSVIVLEPHTEGGYYMRTYDSNGTLKTTINFWNLSIPLGDHLNPFASTANSLSSNGIDNFFFGVAVNTDNQLIGGIGVGYKDNGGPQYAWPLFESEVERGVSGGVIDPNSMMYTIGSTNHDIDKWDGNSADGYDFTRCKYVKSIGTGNNSFQTIALGKADTLFASYDGSNNSNIQKFQTDGNYIRTIGVPGNKVLALAVDKNKTELFAAKDNNDVVRYTLDGQLLGSIVRDQKIKYNGEECRPNYIAVDETLGNGRIYVGAKLPDGKYKILVYNRGH